MVNKTDFGVFAHSRVIVSNKAEVRMPNNSVGVKMFATAGHYYPSSKPTLGNKYIALTNFS